MAIKPKIKTMTNNSVDVLNALRNNASVDYRDYVPVATSDPDSLKEIGVAIMDRPSLQNEFLNALANRIGRVILSSKAYSNPWSMFKKGIVENGETVEDIFVNLAKPFQFDPETSEDTLYKREIPDVRAAFYVMNYKKFYKTTTTRQELKQAFTSWDGVTSLITKIIESMYTAMEYDEFQVMKYMLDRQILRGRLYAEQISNPSTDPKGVIETVKGVSNNFTFLDKKYNFASVYNHTLKNEQYIIINSKYQAKIDVQVLAAAFNMEKAEFMGHVVLVDSFGNVDNDRLSVLFDGDDTYTALTSAELTALDSVPMVLVDKDFFMIFDNLFEMGETQNYEGLYWNHVLHTWKTFSVSPFANAVVFVPGAPSITSVTITPDAVTVPQTFEGSIPLSAAVVTSNYAPQTVKWKLDTDISSYTNLVVTVTAGGVVNISHNGTVASYPASLTISATSTFDSTKSDTCVITLDD